MPFIHIVLVKVKPAIADDSARMAELEAKFRTLATYEGPKQLLVEHAWGPPVYADRARGYNYALYSKFESEQTFIEYRDCPGHKEFVKEHMAPNVDEVLAYDVHM
ncbi:hypothetical protein FA09DRAFT_331337 [Tilletiopsis washingtonensis]|uniref:Stress-response A/B barrel domain-containing protein n=1 Tax=Tilletiopsis washingtonensis TaxID=58919 RepID=A0A316Z3V0_9BASI|nr:hypothetical protein FA09DRAFT_331337 [Tilletiopsis washingtonensis]PWN96467.1 hypothetical protein FA09DRAFT_331337 [Tilletiopsis washingtonensis]